MLDSFNETIYTNGIDIILNKNAVLNWTGEILANDKRNLISCSFYTMGKTSSVSSFQVKVLTDEILIESNETRKC